jgi:hypothetical protein
VPIGRHFNIPVMDAAGQDFEVQDFEVQDFEVQDFEVQDFEVQDFEVSAVRAWHIKVGKPALMVIT